MKVRVLAEAGYEQALLGLSLSHLDGRRPVGEETVRRLAPLDGGHNKFLESMVVWLDITAPRYFWQQFDTYRVGVSKQSESTMHGLKRPFTQEDFEREIHVVILDRLNELRELGEWAQLKLELPEGYLQRRVVCLSYKALRNIILQRRHHRLSEWSYFITGVCAQIEHPHLLPGGQDEEQ